MKSRLFLFGLLVTFICLAPSTGLCQDYKIGVLANRGAPKALKEWKATADYLSAKTGKTFTIFPLEYNQIPEWTKEKRMDFLLANSAIYVELNKLYGMQAIATQINQHDKQPLDRFASLIIVKKDSPISKISDLKGIDFACASRSAFGGWLMTARLLVENGINPDTDLKSLRELKTHDNVVFAVQNGAVSAGSIRSGALESMVADGRVKISDFKMIHQLTDDFPLAHSTQAYPEYPFAACGHVPAEVKTQVAKALIAIQPADAAASDAKIIGWKEPLDYRSVVECLTAIKYGVFKDAPPTAPAPAPAPAAAVEEKPAEAPRLSRRAPQVSPNRRPEPRRDVLPFPE